MMNKCLMTVLLLLASTPAFGALAIDADSSEGSTGAVTSLTWSHTVASGVDRCLIVCCAVKHETTAMTGITYNGVAMTQYARNPRSTVALALEMFYLAAPATGTHNIVATPGASMGMSCGATSFLGCQQSGANGPFRSTFVENEGGGGNTADVTVTGAVAGDMQIDCGGAGADVTSLADGPGQTLRWNDISTGAVTEVFGSTEAGSGSVVMTWTHDVVNWAIVAGSLVPAAVVIPRKGAAPLFFP